MKILVVDDQAIILALVREILSMSFSEHELVTLASPRHALQMLEEHSFDVLLLDIMMPEISGLEVLERLRGDTRWDSMQIIMFTALEDEDTFKRCFDLGANDYIKKPVGQVELISRVTNALNIVAEQRVTKRLLEEVQQQNAQLLRMNQQLQETQRHLVHAEKMAAIGELAAGVAHEINNPIGYVGSNLETLARYTRRLGAFFDVFLSQSHAGESQNDKWDALVSAFREERIAPILADVDDLISDSLGGIRKVADIVGTMRRFARSSETEQRDWHSLSDMVSQVMMMLRNEARYVADITLNAPQDVEVFCHQGQISQVVLNIVHNAVQAIREQGRTDEGQIVIGITHQDEEAIISVRDDGPGIRPEDMSKIFEPFFTTKDVGQGTGLGLSISYDIVVNKHNGVIRVQSTPSAGTLFEICIPVQG